MIWSTFLIATVTLTVTLADLQHTETKKPQDYQGFNRFYMAVREYLIACYRLH